MYLKLSERNQRYHEQRVFINIVDGAGWLARRSDLKKLYNSCDFILNLNTLDHLEVIICKYTPKAYFTVSPKPIVEG
ncbi:MAG: hypothetical protein MUF87_19250 [Anaerolineae bacterium]|jgi:hypothetical protein|nr:hypothetical protein [Anaerolineae bacterium]